MDAETIPTYPHCSRPHRIAAPRALPYCAVMSDAYRIRPFQADDRARLQAIRAAAYAPIFAAFHDAVGPAIADVAIAAAERAQADYLDRLCHGETDRRLYVVAAADGTLLGFFCYVLDRETAIGEIDLNAVHPDYQGLGIGSAMYGFALDRMKDAGMKVATVATGADASHTAARRAYEKAGFGPDLPCVYLYKAL